MSRVLMCLLAAARRATLEQHLTIGRCLMAGDLLISFSICASCPKSSFAVRSGESPRLAATAQSRYRDRETASLMVWPLWSRRSKRTSPLASQQSSVECQIVRFSNFSTFFVHKRLNTSFPLSNHFAVTDLSKSWSSNCAACQSPC